jgi:hypothetical protein
MRALKNLKARSGDENPFSDAQSYEVKARAYCSRAGRQDGSHPVIEANTPEWALWMEYFQHIGHPHAKSDSFANRRGRLTVPANTPDAFEPGWRASDSFEEKNPAVSKPIQAANYVSPEQKAASRFRIEEMYQTFRKGSPGKLKSTSRDARDVEADKRAAIQWLEEKRLSRLNAQKEAVPMSDRLSMKLAEMFGSDFEYQAAE